MNQGNDQLIVITGGPGMGKTSLINCLHNLGFDTVPECGRVIIQQQLKAGGNKLPWKDRAAFANEMFKRSSQDYEKWANSSKPVFFDRGIPDVIGYLKLCELPVPANMIQGGEVGRYNAQIFITPPWEEIYTHDAERKQSFQEAIETYNTMVEVYSDLGYKVITIPKGAIYERVNFILAQLGL